MLLPDSPPGPGGRVKVRLPSPPLPSSPPFPSSLPLPSSSFFRTFSPPLLLFLCLLSVVCAALGSALNAMAAQGWEYVRAETLPSEERSGLTSRTTVWMNVLVFRRAVAPAQTAVAAPGPALVEQPQAAEPADPMRLTDPAAPPAPEADSPRAV